MKIPKRELKYQRELLNKIQTGTTLQEDFIDLVYGGDDNLDGLNPAMLDNLSEGGVYWTPYYLGQDLAVFSPRSGHIVDMCAGIGLLSYKVKLMDSYQKNIKSMTCIEYNPEFVKIGKKLLPEANWICGNAYDQNLWEDLVKDLPDKRFDEFLSNPPFGTDQTKTLDTKWLNHTGTRDLMALEICLRYAKNGSFILPSGSVPFEFSTGRARQYGYIEDPTRWNQKLKKFLKDNKDFKFTMTCDGIDTSIYNDSWKNLPNGIGCEVVDVSIYPWSMNALDDSITNKPIEQRKGYSI